MGKTYLFTSESVSSGHPDKIADQISDAVLDEFLKQDRDSKVACETFITDGLALVGGEAHSNAYVDIKNVAKSVIKSIGYTTKSCFDPDNFGLISTIHEQSSDIRQGVDREEGEQGAGDQGIMFGYACSETSSYMPATLVLSHVTLQVLEDLRKRGYTTAIYPDSKSQYTIEYDGETNKPLRIKTILVSTQHAEGVTVEALRSLIKNSVIPEVRKRLPELDYLFETEYELLVNPTGQFIIGGPKGDTGLCLADGSLVYTTKGLVPIEDIKIGQNVFTQEGTAKVIDHFSNGVKPTRIITDERGINIEATKNHPFRVWDGTNFVWKLCGDLKIGDILLKRRFSRYKVRHDELNRHSSINKEITYYVGHTQEERKVKLNNDFAYLLGWLTGDGNTCDNDRLTFYFNYLSEEEKTILYNNIKKVFKDVKYYECNGDRFVVLSSSLVNELRKLGVKSETATEKTVPSFILSNTNQIKEAYLRGLFDADGNIDINNGRNNDYTDIRLTTTSSKLSQQVANMLYSLGIVSTIYSSEPTSHIIKGRDVNTSKRFDVSIIGKNSIRRFANNIGFSLPHKFNRLADAKREDIYKDARYYQVSKLLNRLFEYDVNLKIRYGFKKDGDKQSIDTNRTISVNRLTYILDIYGKYSNTTEWKMLNDIVNRYDMVRIEDITESEANTWDITLDDNTHAFIANSFVVHNTGRKIIVDTYGGRSPHGGGAFCVDKNTEYLSENGWKKISEYDGGKVAQWDNGEMTFVEPLVYHKHKAEKMYHIKTGQSLDMVLSENHDVVLETSKGNIVKKRVKDLFPDGSVMNGNSGSIPTYFKFKGGKGVDLTDDEIRLQCAFCADGTLEHSRIRVKKECKTERLKALLESTKIPYTHKVYSDEYNYFMFKPKIESKSLAECFKNANLEQFKIIAEEVVLWDGDRKNVFRTTKKQDADFIQFVFMTVYGTAATIIEDDRIGEEYNGGYERKSISYEVRHCTYSKVALRRSEKYSKLKLEVSPFESEDGYMYCFTVPSSMIVLRRNNKVFITGNCGKDPSKVDRSAAYMARYLAKNIVAAGLAKECTVQLSYAIGMAEPLSVYVNTNGTGAIDDSLIANRILDSFDLRPSAIVKRFGLKNPIYLPTATYGHFGKEPYVKEGIKYFGWEELDSVDMFKIV